MTTSYQHYLPMCTVEARHFLPLIPFSAILMAGYLENSSHYYYLLIVNFLLILLCLFFVKTNLLMLFILFEIVLLIKQSNIALKKYFIYLVVLLLLIHPLYSIWKHRNVNYTSIEKLIEKDYEGEKVLIE